MLAIESTIPVLDFETTGTVPGYPDEPWQIGIVLLRNGQVVENSAYTRLHGRVEAMLELPLADMNATERLVALSSIHAERTTE